jgi:hypothetical protein
MSAILVSMDYVYLVQEREFIRVNEPTYRVGRTSSVIDKLITECPRGSRFVLYCNVSNCHTVWDIICNVFDHLFERRIEYGDWYYSGNLDSMKREFMLCIINDLYGAETEIVDFVESTESPKRRSSSLESNNRNNADMLRKIGKVSVLRFKVPKE